MFIACEYNTLSFFMFEEEWREMKLNQPMKEKA